MAVTPTSSRPVPVARRTAWVVAAGAAPIVWFTQLVVTYALVPWSCRTGSAVPLLGVAALAAGGVVVSAAAARREARSAGIRRVGPAMLGQRPGRTPGADRPGSAGPALAAVALAVYSLYVVLLTGIVPLVVDPCA
jgi:hypothetical protein